MAASMCNNVLILKYCFSIRLHASELYSRTSFFEFSPLKFISSKAKYTAQLVSDIESQLETETMKHKRHPGKRISGCISLPSKLVTAVNRIINRYPKISLNDDAESLYRYLHSRRLPIEEQELKIRIKNLNEKLHSQDDIQLPALSEKERIKLVISRNRKITQCLKSEVQRWQPIEKEVLSYTKNRDNLEAIFGLSWFLVQYKNTQGHVPPVLVVRYANHWTSYDAYKSIVYLVARLAPDYSTLIWVFSEIAKVIPSFAPKSLFDFGSGVGSTIWAANSMWGKEIKEYFCVDASAQMNELAQDLLKSSEQNENLFHRGIFFRQFLPTSNTLKYDLVVSSHSLMELPSPEDRLRVIDILWQKTQDILVIIENGSKAGFSSVLEARDYVLQLESSKTDTVRKNDVNGAYVVGPCPHAMTCPRFADGLKAPCCFEVRYIPLFSKHRSISSKKEIFSYVILRRGKKPKDIDSWPRIVSPVLKRSGHVICRMCNKDGELCEVIFTKSKHSRKTATEIRINSQLIKSSVNTYKCARQSTWGDLLPAVLSPCSSNSIADQSTFESDDFENCKDDNTNS